MSFALATVLVVLAVAVGLPATVLGIAVLLAGRPRWLGDRRREPGIQSFLMLAVLSVVAVFWAFVVPFGVAFGGLSHRFTGAAGLFMFVLMLLGIGYAWRRGALRWE